MCNSKIKSILYGQHRCTTYTNKVQEILQSCCEISSFIILYKCLHIFEHSTCTLDFRILMLLSSLLLKCFSSPLCGFWIVAHHLNTQHATDKRLCAKNDISVKILCIGTVMSEKLFLVDIFLCLYHMTASF